jgi:hypothetical protein
MPEKNWDRVPIDAQSVDAPLSRAAIFLVVTLAGDQGALAKVCGVLNGLDDLVKTVGFRDLPARLSCVVGIGCDLWDHLNFNSRPKELRPFAPIKGPVHAAPSTPGDLLFHIRSDRPDLCFEFERLLLGGLGTAVNVVDEVSVSAILTRVIFSALSTARPTRRASIWPPRPLSAMKTRTSSGAAMSSFRNTCTISARGHRFQLHSRKKSSVARR